MSGKVLMFELGGPEPALSVARTLTSLGVEGIPVARKDYDRPMEELLKLRGESGMGGYAGAPLGGSMLVLCELEERLDEVLAALRSAGIGATCLKAILTPHNRKWTAVQLYRELQRERQEMMKR